MRDWRKKPALLALVGLLWLCGCASSTPRATATATSTVPVAPTATTATAPNGQTLFTSIDGLFQVPYPTSWQSNPLISTEGIPNGRSFVSPDGTASFTVLPLQGATTAQGLTFVQGFLHDAGAVQVVIGAAGTATTLGANSWTMQNVTLSQQGTVFSGQLYTTQHSGFTVLILITAPKPQFAAVNNATFQPMLKAFLFLQ
jgi:hypothetical protein